MELGMIGLGKMGGFMTERLVRGGHRVVGYDRDAAAIQRVTDKGAAGADSLDKLFAQLKAPRAVWLMVPAGDPVDQTIDLLLPHLAPGDTIIDGGNSYYKDSVRRAAALAPKKINFVDCGTSGGVWGLTEGYSMMVGGDADAVKRLAPIFQTLAPGPDKGWGRVGPAGSGHFVKMVHNGIEYGIMQAYAEGLDLLRHKNEFGLDLLADLENLAVWQRHSVVAAGSDGGRAVEESHARRHRRVRHGFGRGPLDRDRGSEPGRPAARNFRRARRALPLARPSAFCKQAARDDAPRIRRPCGEDCRKRLRAWAGNQSGSRPFTRGRLCADGISMFRRPPGSATQR